MRMFNNFSFYNRNLFISETVTGHFFALLCAALPWKKVTIFFGPTLPCPQGRAYKVDLSFTITDNLVRYLCSSSSSASPVYLHYLRKY